MSGSFSSGVFRVGNWKRLHLKSRLCGADLTFQYLKHERITVLSGLPLRLLQGKFRVCNSLWARLELVRVIWLILVRFECGMLIKNPISRGSHASLLFTPAFTAGNYVLNFYSVISYVQQQWPDSLHCKEAVAQRVFLADWNKIKDPILFTEALLLVGMQFDFWVLGQDHFSAKC